jgi:hypothetical protein
MIVTSIAIGSLVTAYALRRRYRKRRQEFERLRWQIVEWFEAHGLEVIHEKIAPRLDMVGTVFVGTEQHCAVTWAGSTESVCEFDGKPRVLVEHVVPMHNGVEWRAAFVCCGACGSTSHDGILTGRPELPINAVQTNNLLDSTKLHATRTLEEIKTDPA